MLHIGPFALFSVSKVPVIGQLPVLWILLVVCLEENRVLDHVGLDRLDDGDRRFDDAYGLRDGVSADIGVPSVIHGQRDGVLPGLGIGMLGARPFTLLPVPKVPDVTQPIAIEID